MYGKGKKLRKPKTQNIRLKILLYFKRKKQIKNRIVRGIWALFETKEKKKKERN